KEQIEMQAISSSFSYLANINSLKKGKAESSFRVAGVEVDELGMAHVRLDQTINGLRVYNQQVITHVGSDGVVHGMTGSCRKDLFTSHPNLKPTLSKDDSISRARKDFHGKLTSSPKSELLIYPSTRSARLAYEVEFLGESNGEPVRMDYFIDA